ncbi:MAG: hypothetical protein WEA58_12995 [Balneolaceae bacterium]
MLKLRGNLIGIKKSFSNTESGFPNKVSSLMRQEMPDRGPA